MRVHQPFAIIREHSPLLLRAKRRSVKINRPSRLVLANLEPWCQPCC